jgi:hypothetical protein
VATGIGVVGPRGHAPGDEIVWHPKRPGSFYVLPRNLDEVIAREMPFEAVLAWAASSGDLGARIAFRFVPWSPRAFRHRA